MSLAWNEPPVPMENINPLSSELYQDARVRALWASVSANVRKMRAAFDQLAQNEQQRWQAVIDLEADTTRNQQYVTEQRAQIKANAVQAIDSIKDGAFAARDAVYGALDKAVAKATAAAPEEAMLVEMQTQAAWARIKPVFDHFEQIGTAFFDRIESIARDAVKDGDMITLNALKRELPLYMEGRGVSDKSVVERIDAAAAPLLPSVVRAANIIRKDVERGTTRLGGTVMLCQQYATNANYPRINGLPGWGDQDYIQILP